MVFAVLCCLICVFSLTNAKVIGVDYLINTISTTSEATKGSFLWEINTSPSSYFFGTIHVDPSKVLNAIPANAIEAFKTSDKVFFELDIFKASALQELFECQYLPLGESC